MIIREAGLHDLETIRSIAYQTWPGTYGAILSESQLQYMLDQFYKIPVLEHQMKSGHHFILAEKDNAIIGFAGFSPTEEPGTQKLHKLYVLPSGQKTGAGKALLHKVISMTKQAGARALLLNVNRFNTARIFYEKQGFKIIREEDIAIGEGYFMNDYVMQLDISDLTSDI